MPLLERVRRIIINPRSVYVPRPEPWSHVCEASGGDGGYLFLSGVAPADRRGRTKWKGNILKQTEFVLESLRKELEEFGLSMHNVVQLMWFTKDAGKFYESGASDARKKYFPKADYPTSTLVEVVSLADPDWVVEVQATAVYE